MTWRLSRPCSHSTDRPCRSSICSWRSPRLLDREELPVAGDALQMVGAAIFEGEAGACDQILYRARDQHLAGSGFGGDPSACVHRDARHLAVHELALARVQAKTHSQAKLGHGPGEGARTADRSCGAVERGEEARSEEHTSELQSLRHLVCRL